jgi:hypothetical protein
MEDSLNLYILDVRIKILAESYKDATGWIDNVIIEACDKDESLLDEGDEPTATAREWSITQPEHQS